MNLGQNVVNGELEHLPHKSYSISNRSDRSRTPAEKQFKASMRKLGWQVYRDSESGRLVSNMYRREIKSMSKQLGMALEIVSESGSLVSVAAVEP